MLSFESMEELFNAPPEASKMLLEHGVMKDLMEMLGSCSTDGQCRKRKRSSNVEAAVAAMNVIGKLQASLAVPDLIGVYPGAVNAIVGLLDHPSSEVHALASELLCMAPGLEHKRVKAIISGGTRLVERLVSIMKELDVDSAYFSGDEWMEVVECRAIALLSAFPESQHGQEMLQPFVRPVVKTLVGLIGPNPKIGAFAASCVSRLFKMQSACGMLIDHGCGVKFEYTIAASLQNHSLCITHMVYILKALANLAETASASWITSAGRDVLMTRAERFIVGMVPSVTNAMSVLSKAAAASRDALDERLCMIVIKTLECIARTFSAMACGTVAAMMCIDGVHRAASLVKIAISTRAPDNSELLAQCDRLIDSLRWPGNKSPHGISSSTGSTGSQWVQVGPLKNCDDIVTDAIIRSASNVLSSGILTMDHEVQQQSLSYLRSILDAATFDEAGKPRGLNKGHCNMLTLYAINSELAMVDDDDFARIMYELAVRSPSQAATLKDVFVEAGAARRLTSLLMKPELLSATTLGMAVKAVLGAVWTPASEEAASGKERAKARARAFAAAGAHHALEEAWRRMEMETQEEGGCRKLDSEVVTQTAMYIAGMT